MKPRIALLIALTLLFAGACVIGYVILVEQQATPEPVPQGTNPFASATTGSNTGASTRTLVTDTGTLTVPDFTRDAEPVPLGDTAGDVQYALTPYPEYEEGMPYPSHPFDIVFNELDQQFVITLNEEPLGATRIAAEARLKDMLRLSEPELCALSVIVGVPHQVHPTYATYANLGLSFCDGSVQLPKV
jgi:hypothetical protein